jgi:hypothetical protein
MNDFERFKAIFEHPQDAAADLPAPSKAANGPRFAAVAAPVVHVAGVVEAFAPKARAKKAASAKRRSVAPAVLPEPMQTDSEALARFTPFGIERWAIHLRRAAGLLAPWTADPILAARKFCNIRREDDRVDRWVAAEWREPHRDDPDLWFAMVVACLINEPKTLAAIGYPVPFDWPRMRDTLKALPKVWRGVYKSVMARAGQSRTDRLGEILGPLWHDREALRPQAGETLASYADRLRDYDGIGPFMAAQVIARLKHTAPLNAAADWLTFALPGDGSIRGLNRLRGRKQAGKKPWDKKWPEWHWHLELTRAYEQVREAFAAAGLPPLDMQNFQNVLCEFDKYERTRETGEIPPAQRYKPADAAPPAKTKGNTKSRAPPNQSSKVDPGHRPTAAEQGTEQEANTCSDGPEPHCLAAALAYAARGWKLFPAPRGSKKSHRKARDGGERWGATRDASEIAQDFARWPGANIGLPTDRDNNFWILETDTKAGGHKHDGLASLNALMAQHGPLPQTRMALSPSGSWHYYFKHPAGLTISNRTNCPAPGIDVKGDGGMVIAPPSVRDDGAYRWISEAEIAEAPAWLLQLVAAPKDDTARSVIADAELLGALCDIEAAIAVITNNDLDWESWNKIGMAIFAASGGSEEGFAAFDRFSAKSEKHDSDTTREKWQAFNGCPPDRIGFDFLAAEAHKADPEWRLKAARGNSGAGNSSEASPQAQVSEVPPELVSVYASEIEMEALDWLWPGRFARGKLGIIAGLPDEGKGLLTAYMAACCTDPARNWPCGEGPAPQGKVILFTAEDDLADTVIPRLVAAGAARDRVAIVKMVRDTDKHGRPRSRMFNLARDLEMLRAKMAAVGDVVLLIIDPVSAYLGRSNEVDSWRDTDVRSVLAPLQDLAAEMRTAVIGLMHFNKKVDVLNMLLRICNSIAFAAAARHAYGVVHDPGTNRQLLVRGKNNLARRDDRALAFRIEAREVGYGKRSGKPVEAPFLIWEAEYVDITATEALAAVNENKMAGSRNTARKFLLDTLRDGPVLVTEIEAARKAEGIAKRTLDRAKAELGITSIKEGDSWVWQLPKEKP